MRKVPLVICFFYLVTTHATGRENSDTDKIYQNIAETLSKVEQRLPNKTVAIYGFEVIGRPGDSYAKFATEKLTHYIVSDGRLLVIERSRIDQVLKEQSLSMTGAVDSGTAAKIGKILSVDAVIIGTIRISKNETEFIARVIQSEKGIILASANEKISLYNSNDGNSESNEEILPDSQEKSTSFLKTDRKFYNSYESITINYSGLPGNNNDWITLVPETKPDTTYGEWFYTGGSKSGSYTFSPVRPGKYEIRVYYNWPAGGYVVKHRLKITIK